MWTVALSQSTNSPSSQIFFTLSTIGHLATLPGSLDKVVARPAGCQSQRRGAHSRQKVATRRAVRRQQADDSEGHLLALRGCACLGLGGHFDRKAALQGVRGCGQKPQLRETPRQNERVYLQRAEDIGQARTREGAVGRLGDDVIAGLRRERRPYPCALAALDVVCTPHVEIRIAGLVLIDHIDDRRLVAPSRVETLRQRGYDVPSSGHLERPTGGEVVVLHVDHQKRSAWGRAAASDRLQDSAPQSKRGGHGGLGEGDGRQRLADLTHRLVDLRSRPREADVDQRIGSPCSDHREEVRKGLVRSAHLSLLAECGASRATSPAAAERLVPPRKSSSSPSSANTSVFVAKD